MKFVVAAVLVTLSLTNAEPPRFRGGFARQTAPAAPDADAGSNAPYPASGWKPAGAAFTLPARQQQQPQPQPQPQQPQGQYIPQYPPQTSYGPPPQEYGPPTTEEATESTTTTEDGQDVTTETERPARLQSGKLKQQQPAPIQTGPQIFFILPQQPQQQSQPFQQPQQVPANYVYTIQSDQANGGALLAVPAGVAGVAPGSFVRTAKLQAVPVQNQYYPELGFVQFV